MSSKTPLFLALCAASIAIQRTTASTSPLIALLQRPASRKFLDIKACVLTCKWYLCTVLLENTLMIFRLNPSSGLPLYVQLIEQIKHALETGSLRVGEQLPSVRQMAEDALINPNTVVRAYRELQQEGIIELRHGSGAFIRDAIAPRCEIDCKRRH